MLILVVIIYSNILANLIFQIIRTWRNAYCIYNVGAFSTFSGLDAIVIRDAFSTTANYARSGPFGALGTADLAQQQAYIAGVRAFFRETKVGNPAAKVIGYVRPTIVTTHHGRQ